MAMKMNTKFTTITSICMILTAFVLKNNNVYLDLGKNERKKYPNVKPSTSSSNIKYQSKLTRDIQSR